MTQPQAMNGHGYDVHEAHKLAGVAGQMRALSAGQGFEIRTFEVFLETPTSQRSVRQSKFIADERVRPDSMIVFSGINELGALASSSGHGLSYFDYLYVLPQLRRFEFVWTRLTGTWSYSALGRTGAFAYIVLNGSTERQV